MSYSFGFVVENAKYRTVNEAAAEKFAEVYPEPAGAVREAIDRLCDELPYLAESFVGGVDLPEGHTLNVTVSGHEHVDENDAAPRYQSVTLTLNNSLRSR